MCTQKVLYLHGFNSSPDSYKAQLLIDYLKQRNKLESLICPQIPIIPAEAKQFLENLVEETLVNHSLNFIGSSLGGYYATYLAEKYSGQVVLINPSVKPYETLKASLGKNKFYFEDGCWEFEEKHIRQLQDLVTEGITDANRYLVLLQTGDEVLDYREAESKYKEGQCIIEQGGDHAFTGLERYLKQILDFVQIKT